MKQFWKEALLCWGVVNLLFFRHWARILPGVHDYFLDRPHPAITYLSLMGLILVLAAVAFGVVHLVRRNGDRRLLIATRVVFVVLAVFGIYGILAEAWVFLGRPRPAIGLRFIPLVLLLAGIGWLQWRHKGWHRQIVPVAVVAMMLLVPLAPILYAQGIYHAISPAEATRYDPEPSGDVQGPGSDHRVVWILFDELDQRLVFEERPEDVALPELDRLRDESLYATKAYAPNSATMRSVPAMTTGQFVDQTQPRGLDRLTLGFQDRNGTVDWQETNTVFSRLHDQGRSVGIVGTYHPYCRLFAEVLTECTFIAHYGRTETDFFPTLREHLEGLRLAVPTATAQKAVWDVPGLTALTNEERQSREIAKYQALAPAAVETATRQDLDFAFLHLNVPHPTGMKGHGRGYYDAETGRFATGSGATYFDNLALADRTLGAIRDAMEENGTWDDTTVIVSSDHGYRYSLWGQNPATRPYGDLLHQPTDHRVAFLVKPANDTTDPVQYDEPFNLILMTDLIEAALQDGFPSSAETAAWLDEHRKQGPAHHYQAH